MEGAGSDEQPCWSSTRLPPQREQSKEPAAARWDAAGRAPQDKHPVESDGKPAVSKNLPFHKCLQLLTDVRFITIRPRLTSPRTCVQRSENERLTIGR